MKLSEVVSQLQLVLPKFTDLFSNSVDILSIEVLDDFEFPSEFPSGFGGVEIVTDGPHGLVDNQAVTISDVEQNSIIDSVSKDGLVFTFKTILPHDLTFGYPGYETVKLGGFTDPSWNNSFTLLAVTDRNTFKVQSINSLPTLNSDNFLAENRIDGVNGRFAVSISLTDPDRFTIVGSFTSAVYSGGTVKTSVRIAGTVSIKRSLEQYTEQKASDLWIFVGMNSANTSKDRNAYNDSVASLVSGEDIRIRLIDGFSVFIVKNVKDDIAAVAAMDIARHDLLSPITKSLYGAVFSTGLSSLGDFKCILTGHNWVEYNRATFVYQYTFEFTTDLTLGDSVDEADTRAFSDINYTQEIGGDDTTDATVGIKLR